MRQVYLTIGTRASPLALAQTQIVADLLKKKNNDLDLRIRVKKIETLGDRIQSQGRQRISGTGKDLFTKSIDNALANGEIDVAVHSLKDVPIELSEQDLAEIVSFPKRESPNDVLISSNGKSLSSLPNNARIGTSSVRRAIQIRAFRSDLAVVEIRGNVHTRLKKLKTDSLDAVILAKAGLKRLNIAVGNIIPTNQMLPAVGQGCLAVVTRKNDLAAKQIVARIDHKNTRIAATAERAFSQELGGGCNLPIAALARMMRNNPNRLIIEGLVQRKSKSTDKSNLVVRSSNTGPTSEPEAIGRKLARMMKRFAE